MNATNTNMHSSNGVSMPSQSNATDRQRSMSIPRKSVGDLRNGSNAATARSQLAQPASSTPVTGHKHTMSIPRKSISDARDRNDLAGTQQIFPSREQSLDAPVTGIPIPAMSSNQHSLSSSTMGNTSQAAVTEYGSSTTGYTAPRTGEIRQGPQQIYNRPYMVEGANSPPSLHGIVDLTNTVDTTTHIRYAPGESLRSTDLRDTF